MKKSLRILFAVGVVVAILGSLAMVKGLQIERMISTSEAFVAPAQTVATTEVNRAKWEVTLSAVGSLEAVQGVIITAELAGKVNRIAFEPGARVSAGQLLVQQDVSEERARLRAAQSRAQLAQKNLERARILSRQKVIPDSELDDSVASFEQAGAEVDNIQAIIAKKTIRAPFSGRLGIRQVNLGEVLESGQHIVSLQALDPIFLNFQLPQQELPKLKVGLPVRATINADTQSIIEGTITALNPEVDSDSRNLGVQATLTNRNEQLRPGMYATVAVVLPNQQSVLTVPATAVLHAPYSDTVFVVETKSDGDAGSHQILRQQFVQLGEKRGDFVAVRSGLKAGQQVVSTGVFKLRNGMTVVVDNTLAPTFEISPKPDNA